jgi:hypothetical protein
MLLAAGAQTIRLDSAGIFAVKLTDELLDTEFLAHTGIQFADTDLNSGTEFVDPLDPLQQFAAKLLLRCLREGSGFGHGELQGFGHIQPLSDPAPAQLPMVNRALTDPLLW